MIPLALLLLLGVQDPAPVRYEVIYDPAEYGRVHIEVALPAGATAQTLVMPRAIPMGYGEQPYDRFVGEVQAFGADGAELQVTREDLGPRWRLGSKADSATRVRYTVDVDALERDVLGASDVSKARPDYVGLLGYSVFAYLEGWEYRPLQLTVRAPDDWPVFLTLAPRAPPATAQAVARADNFYALADSQVVLGPGLQVVQFEAAVPLFVAQYAEKESDAKALGAQAVTALNALAEYFGSIPFLHYTVQVEFLEPRSADHRYGFSMEHMESCTIYFDTTRVIASEGQPSVPPRHLYNLAHHMAHSWIPKRCAAEGYFPWTWEIAPVLDSIWFSEGWGQYAAAAALAEEGGLGGDFRETLVNNRFRIPLQSSPPFLNNMDLVHVSRVASTRYSEDFRTGRNVFARGGLMAYEIDEAIRAGSEGRKSLRDLLRRLMTEGQGKDLDLDRVPDWCREETGVDVGEIFKRWLLPMR